METMPSFELEANPSDSPLPVSELSHPPSMDRTAAADCDPAFLHDFNSCSMFMKDATTKVSQTPSGNLVPSSSKDKEWQLDIPFPDSSESLGENFYQQHRGVMESANAEGLSRPPLLKLSSESILLADCAARTSYVANCHNFTSESPYMKQPPSNRDQSSFTNMIIPTSLPSNHSESGNTKVDYSAVPYLFPELAEDLLPIDGHSGDSCNLEPLLESEKSLDEAKSAVCKNNIVSSSQWIQEHTSDYCSPLPSPFDVLVLSPRCASVFDDRKVSTKTPSTNGDGITTEQLSNSEAQPVKSESVGQVFTTQEHINFLLDLDTVDIEALGKSGNNAKEELELPLCNTNSHRRTDDLTCDEENCLDLTAAFDEDSVVTCCVSSTSACDSLATMLTDQCSTLDDHTVELLTCVVAEEWTPCGSAIFTTSQTKLCSSPSVYDTTTCVAASDDQFAAKANEACSSTQTHTSTAHCAGDTTPVCSESVKSIHEQSKSRRRRNTGKRKAVAAKEKAELPTLFPPRLGIEGNMRRQNSGLSSAQVKDSETVATLGPLSLPSTVLRRPFGLFQHWNKVYISPFEERSTEICSGVEVSKASDEVVDSLAAAFAVQEKCLASAQEAERKIRKIHSSLAAGKLKTGIGDFFCSPTYLRGRTVRQMLQDAGVPRPAEDSECNLPAGRPRRNRLKKSADMTANVKQVLQVWHIQQQGNEVKHKLPANSSEKGSKGGGGLTVDHLLPSNMSSSVDKTARQIVQELQHENKTDEAERQKTKESTWNAVENSVCRTVRKPELAYKYQAVSSSGNETHSHENICETYILPSGKLCRQTCAKQLSDDQDTPTEENVAYERSCIKGSQKGKKRKARDIVLNDHCKENVKRNRYNKESCARDKTSTRKSVANTLCGNHDQKTKTDSAKTHACNQDMNTRKRLSVSPTRHLLTKEKDWTLKPPHSNSSPGEMQSFSHCRDPRQDSEHVLETAMTEKSHLLPGSLSTRMFSSAPNKECVQMDGDSHTQRDSHNVDGVLVMGQVCMPKGGQQSSKLTTETPHQDGEESCKPSIGAAVHGKQICTDLCDVLEVTHSDRNPLNAQFEDKNHLDVKEIGNHQIGEQSKSDVRHQQSVDSSQGDEQDGKSDEMLTQCEMKTSESGQVTKKTEMLEEETLILREADSNGQGQRTKIIPNHDLAETVYSDSVGTDQQNGQQRSWYDGKKQTEREIHGGPNADLKHEHLLVIISDLTRKAAQREMKKQSTAMTESCHDKRDNQIQEHHTGYDNGFQQERTQVRDCQVDSKKQQVTVQIQYLLPNDAPQIKQQCNDAFQNDGDMLTNVSVENSVENEKLVDSKSPSQISENTVETQKEGKNKEDSDTCCHEGGKVKQTEEMDKPVTDEGVDGGAGTNLEGPVIGRKLVKDSRPLSENEEQVCENKRNKPYDAVISPHSPVDGDKNCSESEESCFIQLDQANSEDKENIAKCAHSEGNLSGGALQDVIISSPVTTIDSSANVVCDEESTILYHSDFEDENGREETDAEFENDGNKEMSGCSVFDMKKLPRVEKVGVAIHSDAVYSGEIETLYHAPFVVVFHRSAESVTQNSKDNTVRQSQCKNVEDTVQPDRHLANLSSVLLLATPEAVSEVTGTSSSSLLSEVPVGEAQQTNLGDQSCTTVSEHNTVTSNGNSVDAVGTVQQNFTETCDLTGATRGSSSVDVTEGISSQHSSFHVCVDSLSGTCNGETVTSSLCTQIGMAEGCNSEAVGIRHDEEQCSLPLTVNVHELEQTAFTKECNPWRGAESLRTEVSDSVSYLIGNVLASQGNGHTDFRELEPVVRDLIKDHGRICLNNILIDLTKNENETVHNLAYADKQVSRNGAAERDKQMILSYVSDNTNCAQDPQGNGNLESEGEMNRPIPSLGPSKADYDIFEKSQISSSLFETRMQAECEFTLGLCFKDCAVDSVSLHQLEETTSVENAASSQVTLCTTDVFEASVNCCESQTEDQHVFQNQDDFRTKGVCLQTSEVNTNRNLFGTLSMPPDPLEVWIDSRSQSVCQNAGADYEHVSTNEEVDTIAGTLESKELMLGDSSVCYSNDHLTNLASATTVCDVGRHGLTDFKSTVGDIANNQQLSNERDISEGSVEFDFVFDTLLQTLNHSDFEPITFDGEGVTTGDIALPVQNASESCMLDHLSSSLNNMGPLSQLSEMCQEQSDSFKEQSSCLNQYLSGVSERCDCGLSERVISELPTSEQIQHPVPKGQIISDYGSTWTNGQPVSSQCAARDTSPSCQFIPTVLGPGNIETGRNVSQTIATSGSNFDSFDIKTSEQEILQDLDHLWYPSTCVSSPSCALRTFESLSCVKEKLLQQRCPEATLSVGGSDVSDNLGALFLDSLTASDLSSLCIPAFGESHSTPAVDPLHGEVSVSLMSDSCASLLPDLTQCMDTTARGFAGIVDSGGITSSYNCAPKLTTSLTHRFPLSAFDSGYIHNAVPLCGHEHFSRSESLVLDSTVPCSTSAAGASPSSGTATVTSPHYAHDVSSLLCLSPLSENVCETESFSSDFTNTSLNSVMDLAHYRRGNDSLERQPMASPTFCESETLNDFTSYTQGISAVRSEWNESVSQDKTGGLNAFASSLSTCVSSNPVVQPFVTCEGQSKGALPHRNTGVDCLALAHSCAEQSSEIELEGQLAYIQNPVDTATILSSENLPNENASFAICSSPSPSEAWSLLLSSLETRLSTESAQPPTSIHSVDMLTPDEPMIGLLHSEVNKEQSFSSSMSSSPSAILCTPSLQRSEMLAASTGSLSPAIMSFASVSACTEAFPTHNPGADKPNAVPISFDTVMDKIISWNTCTTTTVSDMSPASNESLVLAESFAPGPTVACSPVRLSDNAVPDKQTPFPVFSASLKDRVPSSVTYTTCMVVNSGVSPQLSDQFPSSSRSLPTAVTSGPLVTTCSHSVVSMPHVTSLSSYQPLPLMLTASPAVCLATTVTTYVVTPDPTKRYQPCPCHPLHVAMSDGGAGLPCIPFSPALLNCQSMKALPAVALCPQDLPRNPVCIKEGVYEYHPMPADIHAAQMLYKKHCENELNNSSNHEHKAEKSKFFYLQSLCIGDFMFSVSDEKYDKNSKVHFMFTEKKMCYKLLKAGPVKNTLDKYQRVITIEVAFSSIVGLWGSENKLLVEVSTAPTTFMTGKHSTSLKRSPVDITGGQIHKSPYHFLIFRMKQVGHIKRLLCADPFFCSLLVCPVIVDLHKVLINSGETAVQPTGTPQTGHGCKCVQNCGLTRKPCDCVVKRCLCTEWCKCNQDCQNPLNHLKRLQFSVDDVCLDPCLMDNLTKMKDMSGFLATEVKLACCGEQTTFFHSVPNVQHCPHCAASLQLSWCTGKVHVVCVEPRQHCSRCKSCYQDPQIHSETCTHAEAAKGLKRKATVQRGRQRAGRCRKSSTRLPLTPAGQQC